jgi:hypothetical protein
MNFRKKYLVSDGYKDKIIYVWMVLQELHKEQQNLIQNLPYM